MPNVEFVVGEIGVIGKSGIRVHFGNPNDHTSRRAGKEKGK